MTAALDAPRRCGSGARRASSRPPAVLFFAAAALAFVAVAVANAQDVPAVVEPVVEPVAPAPAEPPPPTDEEVMLARSCVSERSWSIDSDDCAAIGSVVRERLRVRGGTFASALRALAPRLHGGTIATRRWLLDLDADAHRPDGFPVRWSAHRAAWLATLAEARAILEGTRPDPCATPPRAWGSHDDVARRRARGFRFVAADCGNTHNLFGRIYRPRTTRDATSAAAALR